MRSIFYQFFCAIILFGCKPSNNSPQNSSKNIDTSHLKCVNSDVIKYFNEGENAALDSIYRYNLNSVNDSCLKYLWGIYARNILLDTCLKKKITIGECNIRVSKFKRVSDSIISLHYEYFINDSIPVSASYDTFQSMFYGFDINLFEKKFLYVKMGEFGRYSVEGMKIDYENILKSNLFREYINEKRHSLHPKFVKLFIE